MLDYLLTRIERLPYLDRVFDVSLILKGLDGLLELVGGILLFVISPVRLNAIVRFLTQHELSEDPHDFVATRLVWYAHLFTTSVSLFLAIYLLTHGLVKIVLVVAVLKEQLWAYPWMIAFLLIFIAYQVYQLTLNLSVGLLLLTLFDLFIVVLTFLEFQKHKRKTSPAQ
jgi:uncharacterized membrane protein